MCDPGPQSEIRLHEGAEGLHRTQEDDMGLHEYENSARIADLQDIAALDRLAAEGQPPSVLNRWVTREHRPPRSGGLRRLLHLGS
jgi:hypothetical protein